MAATTFLNFSILGGQPNVGGAHADVAEATLATFAALVDSKAAGSGGQFEPATYVPPDGVRPWADHTPAWILELEGALRAWLNSHASDVKDGFDAIGTSAFLPQFDTSTELNLTKAHSGVVVLVCVASGRGGGKGLHHAVYSRFKIATDYRSVQKTGSFSADLASAMSSWS